MSERVNLARVIEGHDGDGTALFSRNQAITYGELNDQVARMRGGLARLGVSDGDRIALICGNGHPFVVGYFAALGLGAVIIPLNPTSPAPELQGELAAVEPVVAIIDRSAAASWRDVDAGQLPALRTVISVDGDAADESFEALLEAEPAEVTDVDPDHLAVLMFTSGTAPRSSSCSASIRPRRSSRSALAA